MAHELRIRELAAVFRNTTTSYKFFWLLAIIDLLPEFDRPLPATRLVQAMVSRAWAPVVLFRLSLGKSDRLQDCVLALQGDMGLPPRTSVATLARTISRWADLADWVDELVRFVPGRFLGSWFPQEARGAPYDARGSREIAAVAHRAFGHANGGPYRLIDTCDGLLVELPPNWRDWLEENRAFVLAFAEQHLSRYLQARNPSSPAIVNKLELPQRRSCVPARAWWKAIINQAGEPKIKDIFSGQTLDAGFSVDHFLPWSFVAHHEFWNLAPVAAILNRSKSDRLPALDLYLPQLIALHTAVLRRRQLPRGLAEVYAEFFGVPPSGLMDLSPDHIEDRYRQIVLPLAQIAANQGFPTEWRAEISL